MILIFIYIFNPPLMLVESFNAKFSHFFIVWFFIWPAKGQWSYYIFTIGINVIVWGKTNIAFYYKCLPDIFYHIFVLVLPRDPLTGLPWVESVKVPLLDEDSLWLAQISFSWDETICCFDFSELLLTRLARFSSFRAFKHSWLNPFP